jgi:alpha/beta superfamily hydrolase
MFHVIPGNGVKLEAVLREPVPGPARAAAVLCHPHPAFGGTMNNRVIYRAGKAALRAGLAALRFNFRGVGESTGAYDQGVGEKEDVASAVDFAAEKYPGLPLVLIGFSFGAWVGLPVACRDDRIVAMIGLGLPAAKYDFEYLVENQKPSLYILGTQDEFSSREKMQQLAERFPAASRLVWVENADHFFTNDVEHVQDVIVDFLGRLNLSGSPP